MKTLLNIIAIVTLTFTINTTVFANGIGDRASRTATPELADIESGEKKLKGVMVFDKVPVMDKDVCDLALNFDLIIEGSSVELFNKSIGDFSNAEIIYGDGKVSTDFESKHTYDKAGVYYIAVSLYDNNTGCMDFVAANVFVGGDKEDMVIVKSSELNNQSVANMK